MRRHKPKQSELKKSYSTGELICREGDESSEIYVIQEGRVEVVKHIHGQELKIGELNKGDFFGEMGILESEPRSASVVALQPTTVLVLRSEALLVRLRKDPTFAVEMLQKLSGRIRRLERMLNSQRDVSFEDI